MAFSIILHIENTEPILAEIDELPDKNATMLKVSNPRQRDGKELVFIQRNVVNVYWPVSSISFIEILPSEEEEEIMSFVRE